MATKRSTVRVRSNDDPNTDSFGSDSRDRSEEQYSYRGEGINDVWAQLGNFGLDTLRNFDNFGESVGNWFSGQPQAEPGHGLGNRRYGQAITPAQQRNRAPLSKKEGSQPGDGGMSFADYLAQASQLLSETGAGQGPDYSAAAEALRQTALQNDAKLAAMYSQLQQSFQSDAPTIQAQYNEGIQGVNQNANQASANTQAGYQAARDAQTQQLAALGIQDAAAVLASNGGNAAADQANAVGNIEQNRATNSNELQRGQTAALGYNSNLGRAASLGGAEARSALAQQLQAGLADLAVRQSESSGRSSQNALDLAFQLRGEDSDSAQALAEFLYQQQQDQLGYQQESQDAGRTTFLRLVEQYDGDMTKAAQAFAQLQAAGLV